MEGIAQDMRIETRTVIKPRQFVVLFEGTAKIMGQRSEPEAEM